MNRLSQNLAFRNSKTGGQKRPTLDQKPMQAIGAAPPNPFRRKALVIIRNATIYDEEPEDQKRQEDQEGKVD